MVVGIEAADQRHEVRIRYRLSDGRGNMEWLQPISYWFAEIAPGRTRFELVTKA